MDPKLFDELTKSLKLAGAIDLGERKPSRTFAYSRSSIRSAR
jgi:hypothetical protein